MNTVLPSGIEAYLKEAGFTPTEMLVLRKLVEQDSLTIRELASKTGKSTGVLDQSMKKLLQKGIARKGTINGQPRYSIRSLQSLIEWVKKDMLERQQILTRKHKNFEEYVASLTLDRKRPDIEYFTGDDGIRQAYARLLSTKGEWLTVTPVLHSIEEDPLRAIRVELFRKRQVQGIFQRVITADTPLSRRFRSRDPFEYRKTQLLTGTEFAPAFERTIAGSLLLCVNHEDKTACILQYPELVSVERASFETLWSGTPALPMPAPKEATTVALSTRLLSSFRQFVLGPGALVALVLFAIFTSTLSLGLYASHRQANIDRIRGVATEIADAGSRQFSAQDIAEIHVPEDMTKGAYARLAATLNLVRRSDPNIRNVYLMRKTDDPSILAFVADADSLRPSTEKDLNHDGMLTGADALSFPGDPYDISTLPSMIEAFSGPASDADVTEDQWGSFITGAAPVRDDTGQTVAILGIDMATGDVNALRWWSFAPLALIVLLFATFFFARFFAMHRSLLHECLHALFPDKRRSVVLLLTVAVYAGLTIFGVRTYLRHLLIEETGKRLMAIAVTAASQFDPADLDQLHFARDMKTEAYQRVFRRLNEIRNKNPEVTFGYIFQPTNEKDMYIFLADADANVDLPEYQKNSIFDFTSFSESDEAAATGTYYFDEVYFVRNALHRSIYGNYPDQWGNLISGLAPITNYRGDTIAIVGFDIRLDK